MADFVQNLFPDVANAMKAHLPAVWDHAFPQFTRDHCPPVSFSLDLAALHPLLPNSTAAAVVGFAARDQLLYGTASAASVDDAAAAESTVLAMRGLTLFLIELVGIAIGLAGYLLLPRDAWAWRRGFLFFAFMNMAAIPTHNILGTLSPTMLVFWSLDVGSTGSSCLCLILASFIQPFPTAASRTPTTYKWLTLVGPALLYAYSYVGIALPGFRIPFTSELVYITMMVIAAVVVVANILAGALRMPKMPFTSVAGSASVVLAISSIIVMLAGFLLDYPICKAVVEAGSTTEIGLVAFVFVGSDIAFLSLFLYVAAGVRSIASKSKKTQ